MGGYTITFTRVLKESKKTTHRKKKKLSGGQMVDLKNGSLKNLMIYRQKQSYFKKRIFKITMSTTQIKSGNNVCFPTPILAE